MDAPKRYHSVQLDKSRCKGCTNCLMHCPTEAIRVRDGRAHIIAERCIDCGECIRICDYHAKVAPCPRPRCTGSSATCKACSRCCRR